MTAIDTQILGMYEDLGMTVDQIADETGFDPEAIKMSLLGSSASFSKMVRQSSGHPQNPNGNKVLDMGAQEDDSVLYPIFTQRDEDVAKRVLVDLMKGGELEIVRASCAKTVLKLNQEERASKRATILGKAGLSISLIQAKLDSAKRASRSIDIEISSISKSPIQEQVLEVINK